MVAEVDPTTSLPTYVLQGPSNQINALNLFGHRVKLSEDEFLSLTHDEPLRFGSHISRLLRAAFITRQDFPWANLALVDTPGYSNDGGDGANDANSQHNARTDQDIALAQLDAAQAIVWVIDARQGCITEDDLGFLSKLQHGIPLFIALSRADQVPHDDTQRIQHVIVEALQARKIAYAGIAAVSARKPRAGPLEPLIEQLAQWSKQSATTPFAANFKTSFMRYDAFLQKQEQEARDDFSMLNRIAVLVDNPRLIDETKPWIFPVESRFEQMRERAKTRLQQIESQGGGLQALWETVCKQLNALAEQMNVTSGVDGETLRQSIKKANAADNPSVHDSEPTLTDESLDTQSDTQALLNKLLPGTQAFVKKHPGMTDVATGFLTTSAVLASLLESQKKPFK